MVAAHQAVLILAVTELIGAGIKTITGCVLVGLARSTFYRITKGYSHYRPVDNPVPQRDRIQPAALSDTERRVILEVLTDPQDAALSVGQAYWRALDRGVLGCSERTFYRVANDHGLVGDRRRTRTRTGGGRSSCRTKPVVGAASPQDLWSWDITELKGPRTQDRYKLYLAMDVFSRYPVAWRIEYTENTHDAVEMFQQAITDHGTPKCLHADNGAIMRSHDLIDTLTAAGTIPSYSRPRVSDDNPFSESLFKTIKYDLDCPDTFESINHARTWTSQFLHRYATEHRHSGIGHYTPASVHNHTAHLIQQQRQTTLDHYYAQ
ncbi:transposase, partial [Nakamurella silvestris]